MYLALKEMARAKVRFGLLVAAVALLVFLILFQQSLQNGLITSFIGAIRNQNAPVLVYAVDGQRVIQGSLITPELDSLARSAPGVGEVGRLGQGTFTARPASDDGDDRGGAAATTSDTTIIGYDLGSSGRGLGAPRELAAGRYPTGDREAVASEADRDSGFDLGDTVTIVPGGLEITVVGLARDIQLNVTPTLFTSYATYEEAVRAANPDAGSLRPNVLVMAPAEGVTDDELVAAVNERSPDLDALTRDQAESETPGVSQVRQSFRLIFLLYGLVVPCVTGLFFLIVTFQKANTLTLLRAIGAPARRLVSALIFQVMAILGFGIGLGTLLYAPLSQQRLGGLPLRFETRAVIFWAALLLILGVASSLLAARRVLAIDPIEATTGAGVGR
jgi:putative ABC transport system permease protein